jgi:hypothetical protein
MSGKTWLFMLIGTLVASYVIVAHVAPCLLPSRMAANESAAINTCRTFAKAQVDYLKKDWDGDAVFEYAPTLKELAAKGLIESAIADAEGHTGKPYHGYRFVILTSQGPGAAGGAKSFLVDGHLIPNVALACVPEKWDETGRNTFIVTTSGTWYQKDTGRSAFPETYDPEGWVQGCD